MSTDDKIGMVFLTIILLILLSLDLGCYITHNSRLTDGCYRQSDFQVVPIPCEP